MCPEPHAGPRGASSEGASSPPSQRGNAHASLHPEEHYHDKRIWLPADKDEELVFLRRIIDEGEPRLGSGQRRQATGRRRALGNVGHLGILFRLSTFLEFPRGCCRTPENPYRQTS